MIHEQVPIKHSVFDNFNGCKCDCNLPSARLSETAWAVPGHKHTPARRWCAGFVLPEESPIQVLTAPSEREPNLWPQHHATRLVMTTLWLFADYKSQNSLSINHKITLSLLIGLVCTWLKTLNAGNCTRTTAVPAMTTSALKAYKRNLLIIIGLALHMYRNSISLIILPISKWTSWGSKSPS